MQIQLDKHKYSHFGNGVKSLPEIFKIIDRQFIIEPNRAAHDEVVRLSIHALLAH